MVVWRAKWKAFWMVDGGLALGSGLAIRLEVLKVVGSLECHVSAGCCSPKWVRWLLLVGPRQRAQGRKLKRYNAES